MLDSTAQTRAGRWEHDGDMHTMQLVYDIEGDCHLDCSYTDLAGNTARRAARDLCSTRRRPSFR